MNKVYRFPDTIYKNMRKIRTIINQSRIKRIKAIIFIFMIISTGLSSVFAIENSNIEYGKYNIKAKIDPNIYITYAGNPQPNYEYYYLNNGKEYSAYCLNLGQKGPEDMPQGYDVNVNNKINDEVLNSIILNGYPYKSLKDLGVSTESQARFATQFAIWIYLEPLDINAIASYGPDYQNVVDAIVSIYSNGVNNPNNSINLIDYISEQKMIKINDVNYYEKDISLSNIENISSIQLKCEDENIKIQKNGEKYSILIPVEKVSGKYVTKIKYNIEAKENSVLFGSRTIENYQDIAVTLKDTFNTTVEKEVTFENYMTDIHISKKDGETNEKLSGVKYRIFMSNGHFMDYTTNKEGEINLSIYNPNTSKIHIQEIETIPGYVIDSKKKEFEIKPGKKLNIEEVNYKEKGSITIIKKTKEYNELTAIKENMPLSNVSFYILDSDMKIIDDITTNEYGVAKTKKLNIGKYYIKEYKTKEHYKLLEKLIEVEIVENDQNIIVNILNDNVDIPKTLPVTGK